MDKDPEQYTYVTQREIEDMREAAFWVGGSVFTVLWLSVAAIGVAFLLGVFS